MVLADRLVRLCGGARGGDERKEMTMTSKLHYEDYPLQVVSDSAEHAKGFLQTDEEPVDLGPYKRNPSFNVFGFKQTPFRAGRS